MSAQPAHRPTSDPTGRLSRELDAVADDARQQVEAPRPATLAQVAALTAEEREAWIRTTPAKDRWEALQAGRRPPVDHEWAERAACASADADLVELTSQEAAQKYAVTLCAHCPVLAWCAADAAEHDAYGLWSGAVLRHGSPAREHGTGHAKLAEAAEWLAAHLDKHGPQLAPDVALAAAAFGMSRPMLNAAADHLGITRRRGVPWELPSGAQREEEEQPAEAERDQHLAQDVEDEHAVRTASAGLLARHSPDQHPVEQEHTEQADQHEQEQQQRATPGRPQRHRGQRTQPRRPKPRSRRGRCR